MEHIWYIHGANATPTSFTYIRTMLPKHEHTNIIYNANDPIDETIERIAGELQYPVHIIAHSLGGIIAVALSQRKPDLVKSVTTISTPFGGSEAATRLALVLPYNPFIKNIHVYNPTLNSVSRIGAVVPMLRIITTAGQNYFEPKPNDGVVTVDSQEDIQGNITTHYQNLNHFEILMCSDTVIHIRDFIRSTLAEGAYDD